MERLAYAPTALHKDDQMGIRWVAVERKAGGRGEARGWACQFAFPPADEIHWYSIIMPSPLITMSVRIIEQSLSGAFMALPSANSLEREGVKKRKEKKKPPVNIPATQYH